MLIKELLSVKKKKKKNALVCNIITFKKGCHSKQHLVTSHHHTKIVTTQVHNKSLLKLGHYALRQHYFRPAPGSQGNAEIDPMKQCTRQVREVSY